MGTRIKEESLLINTERGLVIITGCAHPGIVKVVRRAKEILKTNVYLVMGGFHLRGMSERQIGEIVEGFKREGVKKLTVKTSSRSEWAKPLKSRENGDVITFDD